MSLFITSLNSGSNGNCYYVGNNDEAVLIDAGISCRETEKRMKRLGLTMDKVKAIFISHEHSDHIRGVEVLSRKFNLPVYITPVTLKHSGMFLLPELNRTFKAYEEIIIGGLTIKSFPKFHDASDPYSFIVSGKGINIGVLTDIGTACEHVMQNFKLCHAAFLEANYDEHMLQNGHYPYHLKQRVSSDKGHLSNTQSLEIFVNHRSEFLTHIFLSHLSRDNNDPKLVKDLFLKHAGKTNVIIASRDNETDVYEITGTHSSVEKVKRQQNQIIQTSLF